MVSGSGQSLEAIWELTDSESDKADQLIQALGIHPLVATLLVNRKVDQADDAARFLQPRLADMPDPFSMKGVEEAVQRIIQAIDKQETICVWGDYDVDGVTSASQLVWFFRSIDVSVETFVPDRFVDGYGLSGDRMRELAQGGVDLFITVDCGITSVSEVEVAKDAGAEVIIVDHHQVPPNPPQARAVIDPHQNDCGYQDKLLAACGVTWVLLIALRKRLRQNGFFEGRPEPDLKSWLDLTAIGTVCDMVPLHGLNRAIVKHGIQRIAQTQRPGVRALCEVAELSPERVTAGRIGFHLGPRINAAGRVAHASAGLELLTTEDSEVAAATAREVDRCNRQRRAIQDEITEQAFDLAESRFTPEAPYSLVLARENWHPGVLGIVANKVVERHYRPTILLAIKDGLAQGSARSIPGFRLVEHLRPLEHLLVKYGGHDHAAGMTLKIEDLDAFVRSFEEAAKQTLQERTLVPRLKIDTHLAIRDVDFSLVQRLKALEPYGQGNREPNLMAKQVRVTAARKVGADQTHLKLTLEDNGVFHDAIAFGLAHKGVRSGDHLDIVYIPEINRFRNQDRLQLRIKALRVSS